MQRVSALVAFALLALNPVPASVQPASLPVTLATAHLPAADFRLHALDDARHGAELQNLSPASSQAIPNLVPRASANQLLRREIFGFAPYWNLSRYAEWNYSLLSTVAYFGLNVNNDGTFVTSGGGWNGWNSADLTGLITRAHLAGDRVVLVIKDFNDASINAVVNTTARQMLITQTIAAIRSKNLDGVNVDFEAVENPLFPDLQAGITGLMTDMSSQVHAAMPQAEVTIDTYAGSASWDLGVFKIGDLAPVVDAMFIMAYDSVFSNMPGHAGPNAPLNGWTYNDTVDVSQYLTKAPASKIILGVPYYGYKWSTVDGYPNSVTTSGGTAEDYAGVVSDLACGHIAFVSGWDPVGQSPYAAWWSPKTGDPCGDNLGSPQELYYDNATSLGLKYDLVNSNNLRGTGMWALGYDSGYADLWNELTAKFTTTTPWYPLSGVLTSSPGVSSWSATRQDVFVRGADYAAWQRTWDGVAWSPWTSLGGYLTSDPAAVSWGPNRIDVFARGTDNGLWTRYWTGAAWSKWVPLGGVLSSSPAVASWGSGRLDVFVRGGGGALYHKWFDGAAWSAWESLGGILTSNPAAVSTGPNSVDVFARGTDNGLWRRSWNGSTWSAWQSLGGVLTSSPAVASCAPNHLDVFVLGADSAAYQLGFNGTWGNWQRLGGIWTSGTAAVCTSGTTTVSLYARGQDAGLWQTAVLGT